MIATKPVDFRTNMKEYCERAYAGELVTITRPQRRNVVVISEAKYNELEQEAKAARNAAYFAKLDESRRQMKEGNTITFTMDELLAMEAEDWKPTEKILEFERRNGIKR